MKFRTVFSMPLFNFDTPQQMKARDALVNSRMFPFGEAQRQWEKEMLEALFPKARKIELQLLRFHLLTRREALVNAGLMPGDRDYRALEEGIREWEREVRQTPLREGQIRVIIAMADLESEAPGMDAMPTAAQILERAEETGPAGREG